MKNRLSSLHRRAVSAFIRANACRQTLLARRYPPHLFYCGDNLDQLAKLPAQCVDLIYIDPPFNSNRNYEVFWGETREKRSFEDRHESTRAYIDYMRPRCAEPSGFRNMSESYSSSLARAIRQPHISNLWKHFSKAPSSSYLL